ncbi:MAG: FecR family protein, partial [Chitinophagaceae bacterium]
LHYTPSFNRSDRKIELSGESFFNVAHDKNKPFIITLGNLSIRVIGTAFNVLPVVANGTIEVQVQSGVVKMLSPKGEITVSKGETGVFFIKTNELVNRKGIDANSFSYATGTFSFTDLSVEQVCRYLEKSFDVTIELKTEKLAGCRITAQFDNKSLDYILDVINATVNTSYTRKGNHIYLDGKGCN